MPRALIVLTAAPTWTLTDGSQKDGGFWPPEFVYPHRAFAEAGWDVAVATPGGRPAPVDEAGLALTMQENDPASVDLQRAYLARADIRETLARPLPLEDARPEDWDVVFVPGGFGVFEDLSDNEHLGRLLAAMYEQGKVVSSICSGSSTLVNARTSGGGWLFEGMRMTGFPRDEQDDFGAVDRSAVVVETRLAGAGARYDAAEAHTDHVVVDGRLVTGQNGASARSTAAAVVDAVHEQMRSAVASSTAG